MDWIRIEELSQFQYLGAIIKGNWEHECGINNRIDKTAKLYYDMNNNFIYKNEISRQTKIKAYNVVNRPVSTFGIKQSIEKQNTSNRN